MKKILTTMLIFSAIGLGVVAFGVGGSSRPNANADARRRGPDMDNTSAIVELKGDPISTNPDTKPQHGQKDRLQEPVGKIVPRTTQSEAQPIQTMAAIKCAQSKGYGRVRRLTQCLSGATQWNAIGDNCSRTNGAER